MNDRNSIEALELLARDARGCMRCDGLGFEASPSGGFWKFPPTIGKRGVVPLLFVGLHPRRDAGNQWLYERVMRDADSFVAMSGNQVDGSAYIGPNTAEGKEHYAPHLKVAAEIFPEQEFAEVASVSEYYLCGGDRMVTRSLPRPSRCAPFFLRRVVALARPSIILPLGEVVTDYFRREARASKSDFWFPMAMEGHRTHVVALPHFGARTSSDQRRLQLDLLAWAPRAAKALLDGRSVPPGPTR